MGLIILRLKEKKGVQQEKEKNTIMSVNYPIVLDKNNSEETIATIHKAFSYMREDIVNDIIFNYLEYRKKKACRLDLCHIQDGADLLNNLFRWLGASRHPVSWASLHGSISIFEKGVGPMHEIYLRKSTMLQRTMTL